MGEWVRFRVGDERERRGDACARLDAAEATSAKAYGTFACLAYLTPVFGGIVSDALLGAHRSAVFGAVIMAVGYGAMASEWAFLIGLVLVCVGNGAFKPSISTQLSALYDKNDPKRDSGFSIFYCCINLGAFFSPIIAGTVRVYFGSERSRAPRWACGVRWQFTH